MLRGMGRYTSAPDLSPGAIHQRLRRNAQCMRELRERRNSDIRHAPCLDELDVAAMEPGGYRKPAGRKPTLQAQLGDPPTNRAYGSGPATFARHAPNMFASYAVRQRENVEE